MLDVWPWDGDLNEVKDALSQGRILAIPTESSYGLAVDPRSASGVEAIYRLKERERGKPLPVVAANLEQAINLGIEPDEAIRFAEAHWPAPLTVVAPLRSDVPVPAAAGGDTLAVRVPDHERLRALLRALGHPLTATSANRSGEPAACDLADLEPILHAAGVLVIGGEGTPGGLASTVVSWTSAGLRVLRRGRFQI
ncbi:MAG: L-threonylcarbamoyladenylate synthase [Holophagales bacterium]|nr:L-threonylcarbamoyladenylate synthase [Holophagales bacterium]MYF03807.1 L-threonylcarbamoyladenylate synthase [Holophagales bacterium]MYJ26968.1 L-threonylcarbamoyladenylate synthase [Holophagales bacterium]